MIKYKSNLVCGIAAILTSVVLFLIIPQQIAVETVVNYGITSRSLPYGIAALIGICGIALVIQSVVLKKDKEIVLNLSTEIRPMLLFVSFVVYIFLFEKDWLLSTMALACTALALSKCKRWVYYAVVIVLSVAMYLIFVNVLHIRLHSILF